MPYDCPYCTRTLRNQRGLTQHISRTAECNAKHAIELGTNANFRPTGTSNTSTSGGRDSPDPPPRRSKRTKVQQSATGQQQALACEIATLEVQDVDMGSLGVSDPAADESEGENSAPVAVDEESEANNSESEAGDWKIDVDSWDNRDDQMDSGEETSDSGDESREEPANTQMLEDFVKYCSSKREDLTEEMIKQVELLAMLRKSKSHLNSYQPMLEWHLKQIGVLKDHQTLKDTKEYWTRETLIKKLMQRYNGTPLQPKIKKVRLPFSKSVAQIPVRDARDVIVSLLTEPRIKDEDMLFFNDDPLARPPKRVIHLEDLNTGDAYLKTFEAMIEEEGEVLLPVPFYIDGAVTGQFSDLPLTPVKIALGIHKRETRDKDYAWRELGWIPQIRKQKARGRKIFKESGHLEARNMKLGDGEGENTEDVDPEAKDERKAGDEDEENEVPAQDFHTMLRVILESFVELQRTGFVWDLVYKGKLYKNIRFKIFVPFVKCDTEEADMLCGKFKVRTRNVKHICRYCHCPTADSDDPRVKHKKKKQHEIQKLVDRHDEEGLTAISQQNIQNAWYKVVFHQANARGIHGACPSEMLHAILLGIFKYVRESFFEHIGATSELAEDINGLSKLYGMLLTRQSDRSLPKTNFSKGIQKGKLMAKEYRGVLLVMAAVIHSTRGRQLLEKKKAMGGEVGVTDWSRLVETLLEWESFLCLKKIRKDDVKKLKKKMIYIMYLLKNVARRYKGMGLKLMKFHALVHLVEDMLLYGTPSEYDTGSNESHHKPSKYAAKLTQRNELTFIFQSAMRLTEFLMLDLCLFEIKHQKGLWDYFGEHLDQVLVPLADSDDDSDALIDFAKLDRWYENPDNDGGDTDSEAEDNEYDAPPLEMHDRALPEYVDTSDEEEEEDSDDEEEEEDSEEDLEVVNGGTRIRIFEDPKNNNMPSFKMLTRSKRLKKETDFDDEVVDFLNELQKKVAAYLPDHRLPVFTEHKRGDTIFRGHPNYRCLGPWMDWVIVDSGAGYGCAPCHIFCFVELMGMPKGRKELNYGEEVLEDGVYAVVEWGTYDDPENSDRITDLFTPLTLKVGAMNTKQEVTERKLYLANSEAFVETCIVIPDIGGPGNAYFQVKPRDQWPKEFIDWLRRPHYEDEMDWTEFDKQKEEEIEKERKKAEDKERKKQEKEKEKAEKRKSSKR